jgi:hypothetical protein
MLAFKPHAPGLVDKSEQSNSSQAPAAQASEATAQNISALLKQTQLRSNVVKEERVRQSPAPAVPEASRPPVDLSLFPDLAARMGDKPQLPELKPMMAVANNQPTMLHEPVKQIEQAVTFQPASTNHEPLLTGYEAPIEPVASISPQIEVKPDMQAPKPIETWCQIIDKVKPEGMALELARRSILMAYNDQAWWLSVSPQHQMAKSEIAQNRLHEVACAQYGQGFVIHYVDYAGEFYTPDDFDKDQQRQLAQNAVQAIKQDPMSQQIQDVLGMQLLEKTIQPI